mmetsp:Transcript_12722/g.18123  ORF Transcript_12722/g.18123 Transcript_12722/m.18123 type:complete len:130 (+) Transcript_12722:581-970(+)
MVIDPSGKILVQPTDMPMSIRLAPTDILKVSEDGVASFIGFDGSKLVTFYMTLTKDCPLQTPKKKFWNGSTRTKNNGVVKAVKKTCLWLEKRSQKYKNKLCRRTEGYALKKSTIPPAREVCTDTCNSCP